MRGPCIWLNGSMKVPPTCDYRLMICVHVKHETNITMKLQVYTYHEVVNGCMLPYALIEDGPYA
jgi:hypothetical protein